MQSTGEVALLWGGVFLRCVYLRPMKLARPGSLHPSLGFSIKYGRWFNDIKKSYYHSPLRRKFHGIQNPCNRTYGRIYKKYNTKANVEEVHVN